jgi:hypothetical protein
MTYLQEQRAAQSLGKRVLYKALESCGMARFYRRICLNDPAITSLAFYYENTGSDTLICQIVRGLLFDYIAEMYQVLK